MIKAVIALCLLHQPVVSVEPVTTPITIQDVGAGANSDYEPTTNATAHIRCTPGQSLFIVGSLKQRGTVIPEATGPLGLGYVDCPATGQLRYSDEFGGPTLKPGLATVSFTVRKNGDTGQVLGRVTSLVLVPR
jgi:hypothetical protein